MEIDIRLQTPDLPITEFPLVEIAPIFDVWADGIVDPVELVGHGGNFRTTFFALMKLNGHWARVPVVRIVRAVTAYQRNQLGDMLAKQRVQSRLLVN